MSHFLFNKRHQKRFIPIIVLTMLLLSGCWSSVEIHNMAITNVLGIDINKTGEYEVTAAIVRPGALFAPGMTEKYIDDHQNNFIIETATGPSISKALDKLSNSIPEKLYLGHMNILLISSKIAAERMQPTLDYFHRETQFRPNIKLLITKGKVSKIIKTAPEFNTTLGLDLLDFSKKGRNVAANMIADISQFMKSYTSDTSDPVTGVLQTAKNLGIKATGENHTLKKDFQHKVSVASLGGLAAFKNGKLIGFLNEEETRGLLWIRGELENEIVVLNCGRTPEEKVSVNIRNVHSEYIPDLDNMSKKLTVKMRVKADINEITCPDLNLDSDSIERLNHQLERYIINEANVTLSKVQKQWQTDLFAFGEAIYRKNPSEWKNLAPTWRNKELKDLKINLKVKADLSNYGLHKKPSKAYESR